VELLPLRPDDWFAVGLVGAGSDADGWPAEALEGAAAEDAAATAP